jgi:predicted AlkP superfamily phosphohydrolase/phosphomutase
MIDQHLGPHPAARVLVLGLDGATFDVLNPLVEQGVMPHLARLMRHSARAQVRSTHPAITPVAWTTFQTGCDPQEHGIWDFRYFDHDAGQLLMNHARRIARPTLFDAVAAAGGSVVSLNLPMTYPAPHDTPGIIVGGIDSLSIEAALAPYPEFTASLLASSARFNLATIWKRRPTSFEELKEGIAQTEAAFRGRVTAAHLADEMTDWRLMVVHFQTLDSLQHRCWHLLGIAPNEAPTPWVETTQQALRTLDNCIGELCELAHRRGASLVVVSDHGFGPFREKISLPELLIRRNLITPQPFASRLFYRLARTRWKLHKWAQRQLHPDRSVAALHRPLEGAIPINWRKSTAVALHGNLAALIYFNTPERFGNGPVRTSQQYDQVAADALAAFREATHPITGEPLFVEAYLTRDRFGCDPLQQHFPDLVAIPADGFHTRHKFDRAPQLTVSDPTLVGTHRREGLLMVHADDVQPGHHAPAELRDVAPTILRMLGIAPHAQMSGQSLQHLFTHRTMTPPRPHFLRRAPREQMTLTAVEQHTVENRLRELGYLD